MDSKQEEGLGAIRYSRIYRNNALRKGKAIMLNSVEIKIVSTKAKTPAKEFFSVFGY